MPKLKKTRIVLSPKERKKISKVYYKAAEWSDSEIINGRNGFICQSVCKIANQYDCFEKELLIDIIKDDSWNEGDSIRYIDYEDWGKNNRPLLLLLISEIMKKDNW